MVDIFAQRSFAKTAGLYGYDDCGGNNCVCLDGRHDDPQRSLWCFCCTCILLCVAMYPQWCTMYSYDHIVCWVIILGLTCRVEIPRLGICFITVLTRLCLSTLVLVNARGVNPILVIYSISICQWSVVHPRWSWTDCGPNRNGDLEIRLLSLRVFRHLDNSNTTLITTDCHRSSSCQQKGNWFSIAETSSFLTSLYVMCPAA